MGGGTSTVVSLNRASGILVVDSPTYNDKMNNSGKIVVQWVTTTGNTVLQQLEVPLVGTNKDRLPIKAIRDKVSFPWNSRSGGWLPCV